MQLVLSFLLSLSILVVQFNPFSLIVLTSNNIYNSKAETNTNKNDKTSNEVIKEETTDQNKNNETEEDSKNPYKIKNMIDIDLEGYATIGIPQSHFEEISSSTSILKNIVYKDNKTKLNMGYITNIGSDVDIPGYITREVAKVDTTTNNKEQEIYNDRKWMKVPSESAENGFKVVVWYTLSSDGDSAFWMKANIAPDSDNKEFYSVIESICNSYNIYYSQGSIFKTPESGYYASNPEEIDNGTVADTSNYKANDNANTVFKDRGGYIKGADISEKWDDLEVIIDGNKLSVPCTLSDVYDAGFRINDGENNSGETVIYRSRTLSIKLINDRGTVITATVLNESDMEDKQADSCSVAKLTVDSSKFVAVPKKSDESKQEEKEEQEKQEQDKQEEKQTDEENTEQDSEEDKIEEENNTKEDEQLESEQETTEMYEHEMILAGGVTWDVYTDDMIAYFGHNCVKSSASGATYLCKWSSGNKTMTIRIGAVSGIKSVELSTMVENR